MRPLVPNQMETLLSVLKTWSGGATGIEGVALLGVGDSAAREHAECDVDIVCIVDDPERYRADSGWMSEIDWPAAGLAVGRWTDVDTGHARSRHLAFEGGEEIEVSFVRDSWAAIDPVDPATRRLACNGLRVLHDPKGLLGRLLVAL